LSSGGYGGGGRILMFSGNFRVRLFVVCVALRKMFTPLSSRKFRRKRFAARSRVSAACTPLDSWSVVAIGPTALAGA
jgi:hypothetical protein